MLSDPANVGVESISKLISALLELRRIIEENEIQLREFFRDELVLDRPANDRREALVQRDSERDLFPGNALGRTASGLSTKTTVSARPIRASTRFHHSSKA